MATKRNPLGAIYTSDVPGTKCWALIEGDGCFCARLLSEKKGIRQSDGGKETVLVTVETQVFGSRAQAARYIKGRNSEAKEGWQQNDRVQ